ncbi:MAG: PQQ-binding-like beta-propeller repeat protein [Solirubrobacteraceae bacterium]
MRRPGLLVMLALLVGTAVLIGVLGFDDERFSHASETELEESPLQTTPTGAPVPRDQGAPPEVAAAARQWPLPNHDYANTRATSDSAIDSSTVGSLGLGWYRTLRAHSLWGAAASAPVIAGDVVYFQDLHSDVMALDLATGQTRWKKDISQEAFGPNGLGIGYGKVFIQDGENDLRALDIGSGREVWRRPLGGPTGQQAPIAYAGTVYTGIASGRKIRTTRENQKTRLVAGGSSGWIYAARADDGELIWDFQTVAEDFWGDRKVNSGGGVWFPPAIDTATGMTYWSTGNPAPGPGTRENPNGESRPGDNLYTDTVLAMGGGDGALAWHNQVKPHDMFHHDLQNPPILITAGGRDLVVASGKGGKVRAIDRRTGATVWDRKVGIHRNDELRKLPADDSPVTVYPGFWGGIETPGATDGKTLYFITENLPTPYTATAWRSRDAFENVQNMEGRTPLDKGTSEVVAIDAATGRIRWTHPFGQIGFGATTVVNDLVFTATYDGTVYALRTGDGSVAWHWRAPAGIVGFPAVSGDTIVWPAGLGRDPVLFAIKLGGKEKVVPPKTRVEDPGR